MGGIILTSSDFRNAVVAANHAQILDVEGNLNLPRIVAIDPTVLRLRRSPHGRHALLRSGVTLPFGGFAIRSMSVARAP